MSDRTKEQLQEVVTMLEFLSDEEVSFFYNDGFHLNVNDVFCWACADAETVTVKDIPELQRAIADCKSVKAYGDEGILFACRKRGMRPQGAMYAHIPKEAWPLFDACGPARGSDFGNPVGTDKIEEYCAKKQK